MRTVLTYLFLVGVPFLGVLAVLHAGQRLEAPPSMAGTWRVVDGETCGLRAGDVFRVVQSGRYVVVALQGRPDLEGTYHGGEMRAVGGARAASAPGCAGGQFEFVVRPVQGVVPRLEGTGGVVGCAGCPPRPIVAVQVADGAGSAL